MEVSSLKWRIFDMEKIGFSIHFSDISPRRIMTSFFRNHRKYGRRRPRQAPPWPTVASVVEHTRHQKIHLERSNILSNSAPRRHVRPRPVTGATENYPCGNGHQLPYSRPKMWPTSSLQMQIWEESSGQRAVSLKYSSERPQIARA